MDIKVYVEVNRQFHEQVPTLYKRFGSTWGPGPPEGLLEKSTSMLDEFKPLAVAIGSTTLAKHGAPTERRFVYLADKRYTAQHTLQIYHIC